MSDPPASLPSLIPRNLPYLRKQAKALLRDARAGDAAALARFARYFGSQSPAALQLAQAQRVIALETGFVSWPALQDELKFRAQVRDKHRLGSATPPQTGKTMTTNASLKLGPIDQIGLSCTDLNEAQRFYVDLLDLRHAFDAGDTMKLFDCDGVNIIMFKGTSAAPNSVIYFKVPGEPGLIEQKVNMLKSRGVKVESDAHVIARSFRGHDVWLAFFRDPFGNLLALKSDVPVAR